jgi:hypothetical protein
MALVLSLYAISESEIRISDPQKFFVQNARQFMQEKFASIDSVAEIAGPDDMKPHPACVCGMIGL